MSRKRRKLNLTEKLAAALMFQPLRDETGRPELGPDGRLQYAFSLEEVQGMTAAQLVSLWQFDHGNLHAYGSKEFGPDEIDRDAYWNHTPRLIMAHREKSARDTRKVAKTRRIRKAAHKHAQRVAEDRGAPSDVSLRAPGKRGAGHRKVLISGARKPQWKSKWKRKLNGRTELRHA